MGGVQYICLVGCRLPPLDGYVVVCLVLTIDAFGVGGPILLNILAANAVSVS